MTKQIMLVGASAMLGAGLMLAAGQENTQPPADNQGQMHHHGAPDPARQVQMLTKRLNLSSDQQQQLLPILQGRQQDMQNIRNDSSLAPADRREKMRAAREDSETKIKAVLNDNQKQKYDEMQAKMHERMQQRHEAGQGQQGTPQ